MSQNLTRTYGKKSVNSAGVTITKRLLIMAAVMLATLVPAIAQMGEIQQKLQAAKQAAATNKQRLLHYQWIETIELTLKGEPKPPSKQLCRYGPDGQIQKTPIGPPPESPSGGRLKQRIIAKKKEEMKDYMEDVKGLLSLYVPPDPQKMQQAYRAGNLSLNPAGGVVNLIFSNYAQPGDQMTLSFIPAEKKFIALSVSTYMGQEKDAVTLQVQMGTLPNGINYAQQTVLSATAKQIVVTTTSSDYQKLGGY